MNSYCTRCSAEFVISKEEKQFLHRAAPSIGGNNFELPLPSECPSCREKTRLCWRNERKLYIRNCDATKKRLISMYHPESPTKVYDRDYWWTDSWNPLDYGREFDFSRSFFEQLRELYLDVPQFSIYHMTRNQNSDYSNYALDTKDCYYSFSVVRSENCLYLTNANECLSCVNGLNLDSCELCQNCVDCNHCYQSYQLDRCSNCTDCYYCVDCHNCQNCIGCTNLTRASYCYFNEQLSEEEYNRVKADAHPTSLENIENFQKQSALSSARFPKRFAEIIQSEDSSGDHLRNCRRCESCYDVHEAEDCGYLTRSFDTKDSYDGYGISGHELTYQAMSVRGTRVSFLISSYDNFDTHYAISCFNSDNLFGCIGLRSQSNCVFNKKYSAPEYAELVERIILHMKDTGEWGRFFPRTMSPFGYNETISSDIYPLDNAQSKSEGFNWSDFESPSLKAADTISYQDLPNFASEVSNTICSGSISCQDTDKPFRITKAELKFYQKLSFPLPTRSPDARLARLIARRNPRKGWRRACEECGEFFVSTYSLERPELVFCEDCYTKSVYG